MASNRTMSTSEEIQKIAVDLEGKINVRNEFLKSDLKSQNLSEKLQVLKEELELYPQLINAAEKMMITITKYLNQLEDIREEVVRRQKDSKYYFRFYINFH